MYSLLTLPLRHRGMLFFFKEPNYHNVKTCFRANNQYSEKRIREGKMTYNPQESLFARQTAPGFKVTRRSYPLLFEAREKAQAILDKQYESIFEVRGDKQLYEEVDWAYQALNREIEAKSADMIAAMETIRSALSHYTKAEKLFTRKFNK
jgi:hypothetical protein